jgi:hypothetical protein
VGGLEGMSKTGEEEEKVEGVERGVEEDED